MRTESFLEIVQAAVECQFDSKMDNAMIKSLLVSNQKLGDSSFLLACSTFFTSNIVLNRSFEIKKKIEQLAENILKRELSTESLEFQYNVDRSRYANDRHDSRQRAANHAQIQTQCNQNGLCGS